MKHEILVKLSNSEFYLVIQIKVWIEIVCLSLKQFTHFIVFYDYHHLIPLFCMEAHKSHHA